MRTVVIKSEGAQVDVEHTFPDRSGKRRLTGSVPTAHLYT